MVLVDAGFETMQFENDEAVKAFVADKSEHRNISKGQKAMRIALLWPEGMKLRRKGSGLSETEKQNVSNARLSQARSVRAYSRELALAVRDGTTKLDQALRQVKAEQEARPRRVPNRAICRSGLCDNCAVMGSAGAAPRGRTAATNPQSAPTVGGRPAAADGFFEAMLAVRGGEQKREVDRCSG
jgi:hypothetical protein